MAKKHMTARIDSNLLEQIMRENEMSKAEAIEEGLRELRRRRVTLL